MDKLHLFIKPTTTVARVLVSSWMLLMVAGLCLAVDDISVADNISNYKYNNRGSSNNSSLNFSPVMNSDGSPATTVVVDAAVGAAADRSGLTKRKLRRGKRYLDFTRGTRVSWRTNIKNNLIKINTLWAHAFGFRFNYPFPDKVDRLRPFFKRDVLHVLEDSISAHGFDGRACVLKSYCSTILETDTQLGGGMLFKLLKVVFSLDKHEQRHLSYLRTENCEQILHTHCPLSFNSISSFTDDG